MYRPKQFSPISVSTTAPLDVREVTLVEIQVNGTITTPYTIQRSLDGVNFFTTTGIKNEDLTTTTTVSASGLYSIPGGCYIKLISGVGMTSLYARGE